MYVYVVQCDTIIVHDSRGSIAIDDHSNRTNWIYLTHNWIPVVVYKIHILYRQLQFE